jgi:hypothetical protein
MIKVLLKKMGNGITPVRIDNVRVLKTAIECREQKNDCRMIFSYNQMKFILYDQLHRQTKMVYSDGTCIICKDYDKNVYNAIINAMDT